MTTNTDIIAAIHDNRERGFRLLVGQYAQAIYWHVRRTVGSHDDAEDVTQEVFVRVFKNIDSLRDPAMLRSWLYRIASNEAIRFVERLPC